MLVLLALAITGEILKSKHYSLYHLIGALLYLFNACVFTPQTFINTKYFLLQVKITKRHKQTNKPYTLM